MTNFFCVCAAKSFIVSIWSRAWERAPGWLKGGLVVSGRGSGRSQTTGGCRGAPQRTLGCTGPTGSQREPSEQTLAQPSLGAGQLMKVSQVSPIFLMRFTCSSRKWFTGSHRAEGLCGQNPDPQVRQGLGQVLR